MASYEAQINILVAGQRNINNLVNQLNQVEEAIGEIESRWRRATAALNRADIRLNVAGRQQPRGEGGRFARDPDRQARFAAFADRRRAAVEQRLARLEIGRARVAEVAVRGQIDGNAELIRQAERRITLEQRLNSAIELFQTRQQKFARGGGGRRLSEELQAQARDIQAAFEAAGGGSSRNLRLINSLATGLGRLVERQNEFNRSQALGSKGFEAGRRLQERLDAIAERGVIPSQRIERLRARAATVIDASRSGDQQDYSEALRGATAAISRVERESKKLADNILKNAPRSPILGGLNFPGSPKAVEAQLRQSQKGFPSSPIRGGVNMPGSPIFNETPFLERRFGRRGSAALSEGLIGGAFPLLFGQGIGSALGGGLGGAAGGFAGGGLGFGLSLIGTALGGVFDQLNQAAQETGKALNYPIEGFEKLKEANLFATKQQEYYISKLIESGQVGKAQAEIQAEMIRKVGVSGVNDLMELGDASTRLSKAWAEFTFQLQAALAGPMAGLLNWVSSIIEKFNQQGRQEAKTRDVFSGLSAKDQAAFNTKVQREIDKFGFTAPSPQDYAQIRSRVASEFAGRSTQPSVNAAGASPEDLAKQKQAAATTNQLAAQVQLASRQLTLTGLTLEKDGSRYVIASKNVALQEYENKLLEIKDSWIGKMFNKEQNLAQIRAANLEYSARLKQINQEIAQRQEQLANNALQAELAAYQQRQQTLDLVVRTETALKGEEAGLKVQLNYSAEIYQQKLNQFSVEREIALKEAAKNGTLEQTNRLLNEKLTYLKGEAYLENEITRQKLAQIQFNKLAATQEARRSAIEPFTSLRQAQQLDAQYALDYFNLLKKGIMPAEAERRANFNRLGAERLASIDEEIRYNKKLLQIAKDKNSVDEINRIQDELARSNVKRTDVVTQILQGPGPEQKKVPGMEVQQFISAAIEDLQNLESVAVRVSQGIGDALGNSLNEGINSLIDGTATAQEVFAGFLKNVANILMQEATRMIATYTAIGIAKAFAGLNGGGGGAAKAVETNAQFMDRVFSIPGLYANGGMFENQIMPFSSGGAFTNSIVSSPTLFKFANGAAMRTGVMGEAGSEAIMPLSTGPGGRLGVDASGVGGNVNVVVNVDATGSKVQGDDQQAGQLGRVISAAVQQELIKQKRPGGILA